MSAQVSLQSLTASPSVARFGTEIVFRAAIPVAESDIEASIWRHDTVGGWRQVRQFTAAAATSQMIAYAWTPAWWDAGDHQVCAFVQLVGSSDPPQSACASVTVIGLSEGQRPVLSSTVDFNADLRPDLIWMNTANRQLAMWNLGGGENGERARDGGYLSSPPVPIGWRVAGVGDLDGDGQSDLVLQSDTGYLGVWFFNGPSFRGGTLLTPNQVGDPNWQIRAVADLNHDGHPDLIWQYTPTGQVAFWLMNGTNAVGYVIPNVPAPGGDWEIVGTGDSNSEADRDIFWQRRSTGDLAIWWMNGTAFNSGAVLRVQPGAQWRAVAVTDLDGDALSDIVLQNTSTGELGAWYLNVTTPKFGVMLVPSTAGAGWSLVGPR
jgi:hypothetical protein